MMAPLAPTFAEEAWEKINQDIIFRKAAASALSALDVETSLQRLTSEPFQGLFAVSTDTLASEHPLQDRVMLENGLGRLVFNGQRLTFRLNKPIFEFELLILKESCLVCSGLDFK